MSGVRRLRYAGEDRRPTSEKEIWGWYSYGIAAEVFAVCGVGSFLPVLLEQLARERGFLRLDPTVRCVDAPSGPTRRDGDAQEANQCVINLFGSQINTASFAMYTFSAAVFVQALTLICISAIADHGDHRKKFLLILATTGSIACMLFIVVTPQIYLFGSLLVVISIVCLGSSFVLLNSFLPLLVSNHPSITDGRGVNADVSNGGFESHEDDEDEDGFELDEIANSKVQPDAGDELRLSNQISAKGVGFGYAAAVLVQILSIGILILFSKLSLSTSRTLPMRVVLLLVGTWWAGFSIPAALWLRRRPGPPIPSVTISKYRWLQWTSYVSFAWLSLWKTVLIAVRLRQVVLFLMAWFLLSDAVATVSGTAILFARTELQMGTAAVAMLSITATVSGIAGAFAWPRIAQRLNLKAHHTIMLCVVMFEIIPLYGLLAYIPAIRSLGVGGIQKPWEIYPMGFVHGFVMGGISSLCRSFYGTLIPPGSEASFYALYAVTDKGSSVIGPAIVGRIVDKTGSIRPAFFFLAVLILTPLIFIRLVDSERGRDEAVAMSKDIKRSTIYPTGEDEHADELEEGLLANNR